MSNAQPWDIDGPARGPTPAGLDDALRRLYLSADRAPTDADVPPPSTFPITKAARVALEYSRRSREPVVSPVGELGSPRG